MFRVSNQLMQIDTSAAFLHTYNFGMTLCDSNFERMHLRP